MEQIFTIIGFTINFKDFFGNKKTKKTLLDPLTTIFRLCIIGILDNEVKISINNNNIHIQEKSIMRGIMRWVYGDSKELLCNLHKPICLYLKKYKNIGLFNELNKYAINGLINLKNTYKSYELIEHSLQHYIKLIEDGTIDDELTEQESKYFEIYDIWTLSEIRLAYDLFIEYISHNNSNISLLNALNEILEGKDEKLRKIIIS